MRDREQHALERRQVLKAGGALAATVALGVTRASPAAAAGLTIAATGVAGDTREMAAVAPPVPPLEVIVFNRLAFGPRAGDLDALRQSAASDKERLASYLDLQLNPLLIDDSACDSRLAAGQFVTLGKSLAQLWQDHVVNPPEDRGYDWHYQPIGVVHGTDLPIRA